MMSNLTYETVHDILEEILQSNRSSDHPLYSVLVHWLESRRPNVTAAIQKNDTFSGDLWDYLEIGMGPRRGPLDTVVAITVVYCFIFLSGVFGNVCTCIVIAKNKYMHTATNYYLFNLAVADLLLLVIGLPPETYSIWSAYPWIFGNAFCILRTMLAETSTNASILTITAFTIERYVAICHPMRAQTMSGLKRVVRIILLIWFLASAFSIPLTIQFGVVYATDSKNRSINESAMCSISENNYIELTVMISTFIFFTFPMTLVSVLYTMIAIAIRRSGLHRNGSDVSQRHRLTGVEIRAQQQARARRSVLKMLVAVVVAFFVCWAPFHTQRLMSFYIPTQYWTESLLKTHRVIYYISGVCYFISCTINPILYSIMSLKFRQAFKQTVMNAKCCNKHMQKSTRKTYVSYRFSHKNGYSETSFTSVDPGSPARSAHNSNQSEPSSSDRPRNTGKSNMTKSVGGGKLHAKANDGKGALELQNIVSERDADASDKPEKQEEFVGLFGKYEQCNGIGVQQR